MTGVELPETTETSDSESFLGGTFFISSGALGQLVTRHTVGTSMQLTVSMVSMDFVAWTASLRHVAIAFKNAIYVYDY